jgi:hypothetical protein
MGVFLSSSRPIPTHLPSRPLLDFDPRTYIRYGSPCITTPMLCHAPAPPPLTQILTHNHEHLSAATTTRIKKKLLIFLPMKKPRNTSALVGLWNTRNTEPTERGRLSTRKSSSSFGIESSFLLDGEGWPPCRRESMGTTLVDTHLTTRFCVGPKAYIS